MAYNYYTAMERTKTGCHKIFLKYIYSEADILPCKVGMNSTKQEREYKEEFVNILFSLELINGALN